MLFIPYILIESSIAKTRQAHVEYCINDGLLRFAIPTRLQRIKIKNLFISIAFHFSTTFLFTEAVSLRECVGTAFFMLYIRYQFPAATRASFPVRLEFPSPWYCALE